MGGRLTWLVVIGLLVALGTVPPAPAAADEPRPAVETGNASPPTVVGWPDRNASTANPTSTAPAPRLNRTGESTVRIGVGGGDARMVILVETTALANAPGPGRLRFASIGLLDQERVVTVDLALRFVGVGDPLTFLSDPSSRFHLQVSSTLSLPFMPGSGAGPGGH